MDAGMVLPEVDDFYIRKAQTNGIVANYQFIRSAKPAFNFDRLSIHTHMVKTGAVKRPKRVAIWNGTFRFSILVQFIAHLFRSQ
jgi:hypothetical protein